MNILAEIHTVAETKREMEVIAQDIEDCNKIINSVLNELNEDSYGTFVDELKTCAIKMIDFADSLVRTLFTALKVIGEIAEDLTKTDENGRASLSSSRIY